MKLPPLPVFFPDATRAVVRSLDTADIESTKTKGILVNTFHLYKEVGIERIKKAGGIKSFMDWGGSVISDSGGFQVGSLVKKNPKLGSVTNKGVLFKLDGRRILLTPEKSMRFQMNLGVDMVVVLDDFTDPLADHKIAQDSVERTILWAKRSRVEFDKICKEKKLSPKDRPLILGVVQGGKYQDLRKFCAEELVKIGFDGFGYGGWPILANGEFDYETATTIANSAPKGYLLYGLGIGKPDEIVKMSKMGYNIFDCVLPTRDGRHKRLYVYNADSINDIDINKDKFYSYYVPDKKKYTEDYSPVSKACDCLLCSRYSRAYLRHLFKTGDFTAGRLATIHNLRFYSILMDKIKKSLT
ncbi:queuine tRNA-ribosyltransferase family protein [Candidatus Microgenomates bacterium]|nr:queuine tRNA-ribosyltransferase family protein [Candidatus Microgenomates bacterium]